MDIKIYYVSVIIRSLLYDISVRKDKAKSSAESIQELSHTHMRIFFNSYYLLRTTFASYT